MEYRNLGRTGLKVSELCMGTMQFGWTADEATSFDVLSASFEAGINFIDTADVYSRWIEGNATGTSEMIIGNWIKKNKIPRHKMVIATKVRAQLSDDPNDKGLSRQHIMQAVENSLKRLQVDYIDLYQSHSVDGDTPIEETLRAFDDLVTQGKVRYLGCSNYPAWRLMEALWTADKYNLARYDCIQPNYSLLKRAEFEGETAQVCKEYGIGVIPYSPLARGFLTGKYRKNQGIPKDSREYKNDRIKAYFTDENWALLELMEKIGEANGGKSISQVALAWQLSDPVITSPIIGPRNLEQLKDNLGAGGFRLSSEDKKALDEATAWE